MGHSVRRRLRLFSPTCEQIARSTFRSPTARTPSVNGAGIDLPTAERLFASGVDVITSGNHAHDAPAAEGALPLGRPGRLPAESPGVCGRPAERPDRALRDQARRRQCRSAPMRRSFRTPRLTTLTPRSSRCFAHRGRRRSRCSCKLAGGETRRSPRPSTAGYRRRLALIRMSPTADARLLDGGTAYISDLGMTGAEQSLIWLSVPGHDQADPRGGLAAAGPGDPLVTAC